MGVSISKLEVKNVTELDKYKIKEQLESGCLLWKTSTEGLILTDMSYYDITRRDKTPIQYTEHCDKCRLLDVLEDISDHFPNAIFCVSNKSIKHGTESKTRIINGKRETIWKRHVFIEKFVDNTLEIIPIK